MSKNIVPSQLSPPPNPFLQVKLLIVQERLRQARRSFDLAIIATSLSFGISVVGAECLLANQASEGAVATAIGLVAGVRCVRIAKDANNRVDRMLAEVDEEG